MEQHVARARSFVAERYPDAVAAFLGGSTASGHATPTSDLDVVVVLPDTWGGAAFVETVEHDGQLVEAFVYGRAALTGWLAKGRAERRPVLDRLVGEGLPLTTGEVTDELARASRAVLSAGPAPVGENDLRARRYVLSALLDDLDTTDDAERFAITITTWREAAGLALCLDRHWLGTGKWLVRELRSSGDRFGLAAWAAGSTVGPTDLATTCRAVLDAAGGYLQAGFTRGSRPLDLPPYDGA